MRIIKDVNRRTKVKLYILKEDSKIVDIQKDDHHRVWYELDGKEYHRHWQTPKDVIDRLVRLESSLTKKYGYKEVTPFIFEASFYSSGSGSTSRYTDILYLNEFCKKNSKSTIDYIKRALGQQRLSDEKFKQIRVGITVGNLHEFFNLCKTNPGDFNIDKSNGVVVFTGKWEFETNKNSLCIKPYVE